MVEKKRKPQEIVPLMLRLREALRLRLAKDAEKAAKSLNAEIVDRLEASYTKDERIEELKALVEKLSRDVAAEEEATVRLTAQVAQAENDRREAERERRQAERVRVDTEAQIAKLQSELAQELPRLKGAEALLEGLMGQNKLKAQAVRLWAIEIAKIPDDQFAATFETGALSEQVTTQLKAYIARAA
jgi:chromosome segregation ATPase